MSDGVLGSPPNVARDTAEPYADIFSVGADMFQQSVREISVLFSVSAIHTVPPPPPPPL